MFFDLYILSDKLLRRKSCPVRESTIANSLISAATPPPNPMGIHGGNYEIGGFTARCAPPPRSAPVVTTGHRLDDLPFAGAVGDLVSLSASLHWVGRRPWKCVRLLPKIR